MCKKHRLSWQESKKERDSERQTDTERDRKDRDWERAATYLSTRMAKEAISNMDKLDLLFSLDILFLQSLRSQQHDFLNCSDVYKILGEIRLMWMYDILCYICDSAGRPLHTEQQKYGIPNYKANSNCLGTPRIARQFQGLHNKPCAESRIFICKAAKQEDQRQGSN